MNKWKITERASIALLITLSLLLAVSFLPIGESDKPSVSLDAYNAVAYDEKVSPEVKKQIIESVVEKKEKITVLVRSTVDVESEIKKSKGKIKNTAEIAELKFVEVEISVDKISNLADEEEIVKIYPNYEYYPLLVDSVPLINANTFWDAGYKGNGVKVAVIDSGIDKNHPMLSGKVVAERDFSSSGSANDISSHGTHVAGIIAGTTANGGSYSGVAPEVKLLNAKVIADSTGFGSTSWIISAIDWAIDPDNNPGTDDGADIISMSLGVNKLIDVALNDAIKGAVDNGVVVVVSSGNCGNGCPSGKCGSYRGITSPGSSPDAISVGAVDKNKQVACFSSGGSIDDVGIKPDITAPGVDIISSIPNSNYISKSGTSMAAPHVSGAVALLLQRKPELTPADVKHVLESTSVDLGSSGKDTSYGAGMLDLSGALNFYSNIEFTVNSASQINKDDTQTLEVQIFDNIPIVKVVGKITKPDNSQVSFTLNKVDTNHYSYVYSDTSALGSYSFDIDITYQPSLQSSDGSDAPLEKTAFYSNDFRVVLPAGDFGNVEAININEQQSLSNNLVGSLNFRNTATTPLDISIILQLIKNNSEEFAQEIRLPSVNVAADSTSTINVDSELEVLPGNYTIRILTDYGVGSLINETNITVIDDLAPEIVEVKYTQQIMKKNPQVFFVKLKESGELLKISLDTQTYVAPCPASGADLCIAISPTTIDVNYTVETFSELGVETDFAITIYDDFFQFGDKFETKFNACDEYDNCVTSDFFRFDALDCSGKDVLVVKTYDDVSVFEEATSSNVCLSVLNRSVSGTPPNNYLENFDAVIWTTGTDLANIDENDAAALIDYYDKKGKVIVEGSDVAFKHQNNELMQTVLHSELGTDLGFSVTSTTELEQLKVNITRSHPLISGLQNLLLFNETLNPFPDSIRAYNGSVELAEWTGLDTTGSAIVAYEDEQKKSLFLPFSINALEETERSTLASNSLNWLLEENSVDITPSKIEYKNFAEDTVSTDGFCIMMCVAKWQLEDGVCSFNECGSACDTSAFDTEEECEAEAQQNSLTIPIENQPFNMFTFIESTEQLQTTPAIEILVDGIEVTAVSDLVNENEYSYLSTLTLNKGLHTVQVIANNDFSISENNYLNNLAEYDLIVYPSESDLLISGMSYKYDENLAAIVLDVNVSNMGGTTVTSLFKVYIDDVETSQKNFDLGIGKEKTINLELPSDKGTYNLKIVADPDNAIVEFNESNNELQEQIYLCSKEKILVVNDNDAEFYSTENPSSANEFIDVLKTEGYCVDTWDETQQGPPSLDHLETFPLVIWSAGDYFDNVLSNEDKSLLSGYSQRLLIEGSDLAMDLGDDVLLETLSGSVFGQDMLIETTTLTLNEHFIVDGITSITIDKDKSPYPDEVEAVTGDVVANWENGAAAITTNSVVDKKTVYYGFSVDAVTDNDVRKDLILNTVEWLTILNKAPEILKISGDFVVNENEMVNIRVEASDDGDNDLTVTLNDTRFKTSDGLVDGVGECGGIMGKQCEDGLMCVVPENCIDCFGVCNVNSDSIVNFFEWQTTNTDAGTYLVNATVSDGRLNTSEVVEIIVNEALNSPPIVSLEGVDTDAIAITLNEGETKTFSIIASDPDGDLLTYKWLLDGVIVSTTTEFAFSPKYNESGTYNLTIIVSDGEAETSLEFTVIVLDTLACEVGQTKLCALQDGVCTDSVEVCTSDGEWLGCTEAVYISHNNAYEVNENTCDALDNNCDGTVDEDFDDYEGDGVADCVDDDWDNDGVDDDEDDLIGNDDDIEFKGDDKDIRIKIRNDLDGIGMKRVKINNSNKRLIEFSHNFSKKRVYLKNLTIDKQKNDDSDGFTLVKGLDLGGGKKSVYVDRLSSGSNAVCVKDAEVSSITEVSSDCTGEHENLLNCELNLLSTIDEDSLSCYLQEHDQFIITGLSHSVALEQCTDFDGDTYLPLGCTGGLDCNDEDGLINPDVIEICNQIDDNCNGLIDENRVCNTPPVMDFIGNKSVDETNQLSFTVSATDNEGDLLFYNATGLPEGATYDNSTATFDWTPTFAQSGTYYFTFNVSDGLVYDYEQVNITVVNVNRPPVITSHTAGLIMNEGGSQEFTVVASDLDNEELSYSWKINDVETSTTSTFTYSPSFDDAGEHTISIEVSDGDLTDSKQVTVLVLNVNRPSVITAVMVEPAGLIMNEEETKTFFSSVSDDEGEAISVAWSVNDEPVEIGPTFEFNPTYEDSGEYLIEVEVSDGEFIDSQEFTVVVNNVNRVPLWNVMPQGPSILEDSSLVYDTIAIDLDGDSLSYSVNDESFSIDSEGTLSWIPPENYNGVTTVTLTADDGEDSTDNEISVTVTPVNDPPVIDEYFPKQVDVGGDGFGVQSLNDMDYINIKESQKQQFTVTASDVDDETLTINWYVDGERRVSSDSYLHKTHFRSTGTYDIKVEVSDSEYTVSKEWELTVSNVNIAPKINGIFATSSTPLIEDQTINFSVNAYDFDQDIITYKWYVDTELTSDESTMEYYFDYLSNGEHNITVVVSDGELERTYNRRLLIRNINRPPEIESVLPEGPVSLDEGESIEFSAVVNDSDEDDEARYRWLLDGRTVGLESSYIYTPDFNSRGKHHMKLIVSDEHGLKDYVVVEIEVGNVNQAPKILYGPQNFTIREGVSRNLTINAIHPDDASIYYNWYVDDGWVSSKDVFEYSPDYDSSGTHEFYINVSDRFGKSASHNFNVEVLNTNRAPILEPLEEIIVTEGEPVTIVAAATDPDNENEDNSDDNELTFSISNSWFVQDENKFSIQGLRAGEYTINIRVFDGQLSDHQNVNIIVE
mgnify:CR=1 FL=1|tara:strand:+ start:1860 stop:10301 length:8442 start_codon:yes stop_codon:yes gene_type:complete